MAARMKEKGKDRRLLFVISYHHACNDGALIALVALLPILADEMSLSYTEIGILGLGLMITVVVQLIVGRITDRAFSRYLLEVGALLMAVSFVMVLFVSDFTGLFMAVVSMRVGASFYHPVGITWITKEYAGPYLDTALGVQSGIGNFGVIASLATSGFLGEVFGWKMPCMLWAGLNLAAVVLGILLTEKDGPKQADRPQRKPTDFRETMSKVSIYAMPLAAGGALYGVTTYYGPINLTATHGWSAGMADLLFAVWLTVGTISSYYFGAISAHLGRKKIVIIGYVGSVLGLAALFLTSEWYIITPALAMFGGVMFLTYPALFAMVSDVTSSEERGTAFGMVFAYQLGGGSAVVYLCGLIADRYDNPSYAFPVTAAFALASLALFAFSRNGSKGDHGSEEVIRA